MLDMSFVRVKIRSDIFILLNVSDELLRICANLPACRDGGVSCTGTGFSKSIRVTEGFLLT